MATHLLLTYDFPPMGGGIARWMAALADRYPDLIVSTGRMPGSDAVDRGFPNRVDRTRVAAARLRTVPGLLRWARRATLLTRRHDVDFVWCGVLKPAGYPARWVHERLGVPYGVMLQGGDLLILQHHIHRSRLKWQAARALLSSASVLVAISQYTRELCISVLSELELPVTPEKVRVVPLGTDPDFFRPGIPTDDVRRRYGLGEGRWLLTVARLVAHKGVDTVIQAVARLAADHPDLRYAVVGSGQRLSELRALADQLNVADRVSFLTGVPDADLPALYNAADIYLGVSRRAENGVEGFGISLVEASACGRPVIGGRSGGIPDAVRDGETGLLVDSEKPEEVAAAVGRLLGDPALAARLGAGGRAAVESYYNWDRVVSDLRSIAGDFTRPLPSAVSA